jgi:hypothetical protein
MLVVLQKKKNRKEITLTHTRTPPFSLHARKHLVLAHPHSSQWPASAPSTNVERLRLRPMGFQRCHVKSTSTQRSSSSSLCSLVQKRSPGVFPSSLVLRRSFSMGARPLPLGFTSLGGTLLPQEQGVAAPISQQLDPAQRPLPWSLAPCNRNAQAGVRARLYHGRVGGRISRRWWRSRPVLQGLLSWSPPWRTSPAAGNFQVQATSTFPMAPLSISSPGGC